MLDYFHDLVCLQIILDGLDSVLGYEHNFHCITGIDISLASCYESILDNLHYLLRWHLSLLIQSILMPNHIVQQRDHVGLPGSSGGIAGSLEGSNGIVRIDGALTVSVNTTKDVKGIIGEHTSIVKGVAQHLCD